MIFTEEWVQQLYDLLEPCKGLEQAKEWHPEKDVYNHSFQVLHHALRESNSTDVILAAFMHDVGKSVDKLGHDKEGAILLVDILSAKSVWLVNQHMRVKMLLDGQIRKYTKAKELLEHPWLPDLIAIARWDVMGRQPRVDRFISVEDLTHRLNYIATQHFKEKPDAGSNS